MGIAARLRSNNVIAGGGGVSISDSFNRADSSTTLGSADTGQTWTALGGVWGIASNQARCFSNSTQSHAVVDAGLTNVTVQVTMSTVAGAAGGLCWRAADPSNLWMWEAGNGLVYKVSGGSYTGVLGQNAGLTAASGDVIKVVTSGNVHTFYKNGTQVGTLTDAFNSTATKHGLRDYNGLSRFDDFTVT
jgi:hypothetical protein